MYPNAAWRLDMLCMQRWFSADPACIQWLFELLLAFFMIAHQSNSCDLWPLTPLASIKHLPPHCSPRVMFSLSGTVNPRDGCSWKSLLMGSEWNTRCSHFDTSNHVQSNSNPLTSLFWSPVCLDMLSATTHNCAMWLADSLFMQTAIGNCTY